MKSCLFNGRREGDGGVNACPDGLGHFFTFKWGRGRWVGTLDRMVRALFSLRCFLKVNIGFRKRDSHFKFVESQLFFSRYKFVAGETFEGQDCKLPQLLLLSLRILLKQNTALLSYVSQSVSPSQA